LHDDFVYYLWDSLRWITSTTLDGTRLEGSAMHGISIIDGADLARLGQVFTAWADLFALGSKPLTLRGPWSYYAEEKDDYVEEGRHRVLVLDRDETVRCLRRLAALCYECLKHGLRLAHFGFCMGCLHPYVPQEPPRRDSLPDAACRLSALLRPRRLRCPRTPGEGLRDDGVPGELFFGQMPPGFPDIGLGLVARLGRVPHRRPGGR